MKANLLPRLWPSTMCASSCESTAARLASSGSVSISPRLMMIVFPTLKVSSGNVTMYAGANRARQVNVVGDFNVVDHGLKDLVHLTCRREQPGLLQTLHYVVFSLLLPLALGFQRR